MNTLEQYNAIFIETVGANENMLNEDLVYQSIPDWDSVGHMQLMAALEDTFDIMLDTDDIIDFNSYEAGKTILEKYGVSFS